MKGRGSLVHLNSCLSRQGNVAAAAAVLVFIKDLLEGFSYFVSSHVHMVF